MASYIGKSKFFFVSLIIPAYKKERTIFKELQYVKSVMDAIEYEYEIIVVVDGYVDKTMENARRLKSNNISVIGYPKNHGKGYAIQYGMVKAKGDIIGFIDAGSDINPVGLSLLLKHFAWYDADIIVGSKRHPDSKIRNYPFIRKCISFLSQIYIRLLFGLRIRDTQVGIKFFKKKVVHDVVPRLLVKRFAFDIEFLAIAHSLGYTKIFESPVELNFDIIDSSISQELLSALIRTFWDTLAIFYRLNIRHYYKTKNKNKWKSDPELRFNLL